jgi:alpha-tubulin suppressor-like RCC1 family protein
LLGSGFSCALLARGAVRCWGQGYYGALGYANTNPVVDVAAAPDLEIGGMVTQIAKTNTHSCALLSGGAVRCWGDGRWGELGYGNIANNANIGDDETPAAAGDVALGGVVTQIAVGNVHSFALFASGKVRCWGNGMWELLGTSSASDIGDDELPASAADVALGDVTVKQIVAGCVHTCALLTNGRVRCWGANTNQSTLGYGMPGYSAPSVDLPIVPLVKQLAAGCYHTCAVLVDGNVLCWGFNGSGQLGYGDKNDVGDNEPPSRELDLGGPVSQVATGGFHSCALLTDGSMRCWGRGAEGQLGSGSTANIGDDELPMAGGPVLWR